MEDSRLASVAAAIAEPARARMLCSLLDGKARTATELAIVGEVSASTASAHLARLKTEQLVSMLTQGRHRYYRLHNHDVASALEALLLISNTPKAPFNPNTPHYLQAARTCYDHMAGSVAVQLHDRLFAMGWLQADAGDASQYVLSEQGQQALSKLGMDLPELAKKRRRFACACLDWSERSPHLGGALGAALLILAKKRGWAEQDLDSRRLQISRAGQNAMKDIFGITI
ncbi:helix-turn-helix domain-containing protein [Iodobacter sp. LRB]|uniref:ArsR/SmtB family transcription factor n=1 Tax=unclassified Iodobacter TaxID=235634 RepID=UPI000C0F0D1C|nr:helix-turn-helix domain-containing protein [Iodobacter sp. BJB302]PHV00903.1 transcriptional regulator [Iodobacter sp. BJB302]